MSQVKNLKYKELQWDVRAKQIYTDEMPL